jgi:hypothetical protein
MECHAAVMADKNWTSCCLLSLPAETDLITVQPVTQQAIFYYDVLNCCGCVQEAVNELEHERSHQNSWKLKHKSALQQFINKSNTDTIETSLGEENF